jgi:tryptophanyl-tRNA synthetase
LDYYNGLARKNARDIIACGFDKNKTFIFSNLESNCGDLYFNNTLIMKHTSMNQVRGIYGLGESVDPIILEALRGNDNPIVTKFIKDNEGRTSSNSVGQCVWPCFQCGPAFSTSFRSLFCDAINNKNDGSLTKVATALTYGKGSMRCLVPMAIDQAPYFRMARDVAETLGCCKPAVIHSEFLPGLKRNNDKMSSTGDDSVIFLDMKPEDVIKSIKKHAFSGGRDTLEEHRRLGGNIKIDICYQYLTYFLDSDEELEEVARKYSSGEMTTGELKEFTADIVANIVRKHQEAKALVTDDVVNEYFSHRILDIGGCVERECLNVNEVDYLKQGIDFDRTFGY